MKSQTLARLNPTSLFLPVTICMLVVLISSCSNREFHIYSDPAYSQQVESKFNERKALAINRDTALFEVFTQRLSVPEQEGLKFLYAFMPLSDLADYDGNFFLKQVQWSLAAREVFAWGKIVPEDLFRHFVLPYRVNNENLDTARIVIFNELKDRIKDMTMLNAAMEVNHWCHEKVTYRGSDIRTSSPLASMKTAYGRCGEESTFTVAALRAVSIPARQVYTPRWAHSDDNHAWVEFWADGKWHYMGACEPECIPDMGWFTEPARRAMLIHTKAFGEYKGEERAENREANYALLNTLSAYAPTKEIHIEVKDANGLPVQNAKVEFQLYNYAEYYPLSIKKTDNNGYCNFLTGMGDLLVWANSDDLFAFKKITVAEIDTLKLTLDQKPYSDLSLEFDMVPPIQQEPLKIANDCRDQNNFLLRQEDSIRGAYEKTFPTEHQSKAFATALNLDPDEVWNFISRSRGNYSEIESFLKTADPTLRAGAMNLLSLISDKDLRDTKAAILLDHLQNTQPNTVKEGVNNQNDISNPRVANEMLVAYRKLLIYNFGQAFIDEVRQSPGNLIDWIRQEIKISSVENYYNTPLTPVGVFNLRVADPDSRKIFAVAAYRTFGIPSRLKSGTLEVEYWFRDRWITVDFSDTPKVILPEATLVLKNSPFNPVKPQYETHYTLAHFENGKYITLAYGYDNFGDLLATPLVLAQGYYLLVTGNRLPGGAVMSSLTFFELNGSDTKELMITLRKPIQSGKVLGTINPAWSVKPLGGPAFDQKKLLTTDQTIICWIEPDKETSKHVFQDLAILKTEIDKLNCSFVFLIPDNKLPAGFSPGFWKNLPAKSQFFIIPDLSSLSDLEKATGKTLSGQFPVVIRINKDGNVTYLSSGYKIGIGEEIIKEAANQ